MSQSSIVHAPDIECEHCGDAIRAALLQLDGVNEVAVDIDAGTVTVSHDAAIVPEASIRAVLEEVGYPTSP